MISYVWSIPVLLQRPVSATKTCQNYLIWKCWYNWIIPSAYASAYALVLLQFACASLRNSGFGLREASHDTTLSTHVMGGLGRCWVVFVFCWETWPGFFTGSLWSVGRQDSQRENDVTPSKAFFSESWRLRVVTNMYLPIIPTTTLNLEPSGKLIWLTVKIPFSLVSNYSFVHDSYQPTMFVYPRVKSYARDLFGFVSTMLIYYPHLDIRKPQFHTIPKDFLQQSTRRVFY